MTANTAHDVRAYRSKFQPRLDILDEVVAGLLWLRLDLPDDVSRQEMEGFARRLVERIRGDADIGTIERELVRLQCSRLSRSANPHVIRELARRAVIAVRGSL